MTLKGEETWVPLWSDSNHSCLLMGLCGSKTTHRFECVRFYLKVTYLQMMVWAKLNHYQVTALNHVCFFQCKGQPDQSDCKPGPSVVLQTNMSSPHTPDRCSRFRQQAKEAAVVGLVRRFSNESGKCGNCGKKTLEQRPIPSAKQSIVFLDFFHVTVIDIDVASISSLSMDWRGLSSTSSWKWEEKWWFVKFSPSQFVQLQVHPEGKQTKRFEDTDAMKLRLKQWCQVL